MTTGTDFTLTAPVAEPTEGAETWPTLGEKTPRVGHVSAPSVGVRGRWFTLLEQARSKP